MITKTTPNPRVPRASLSDRIGALSSESAKNYATFILNGSAEGHLPCWGAIADRFVEVFPGDDDRLKVLDELIKEGDRRPLYLFLEVNRDRPKVLELLAQRVGELPVSVQRGLVSMPEAAGFIAANLKGLDPAARRVWEGGEALKHNERELLAGRVGILMSFKYFVPDVIDPRHESSAKAASPGETP